MPRTHETNFGRCCGWRSSRDRIRGAASPIVHPGGTRRGRDAGAAAPRLDIGRSGLRDLGRAQRGDAWLRQGAHAHGVERRAGRCREHTRRTSADAAGGVRAEIGYAERRRRSFILVALAVVVTQALPLHAWISAGVVFGTWVGHSAVTRGYDKVLMHMASSDALDDAENTRDELRQMLRVAFEPRSDTRSGVADRSSWWHSPWS